MSAAEHDPACPIFDLPVQDCVVCSAIAEARGQEKQTFNETWKANIGPVTERAYQRGYRDGMMGRPNDWTRW